MHTWAGGMTRFRCRLLWTAQFITWPSCGNLVAACPQTVNDLGAVRNIACVKYGLCCRFLSTWDAAHHPQCCLVSHVPLCSPLLLLFLLKRCLELKLWSALLVTLLETHLEQNFQPHQFFCLLARPSPQWLDKLLSLWCATDAAFWNWLLIMIPRKSSVQDTKQGVRYMTQPLPDPALHIRCNVMPIFCQTATQQVTHQATSKQLNRGRQTFSWFKFRFWKLSISDTLTVAVCALLELVRWCEEGDAAGEEPDRCSEEQDEADSESWQPTLGEETFPCNSCHKHTPNITHMKLKLPPWFLSYSLAVRQSYFSFLKWKHCLCMLKVSTADPFSVKLNETPTQPHTGCVWWCFVASGNVLFVLYLQNATWPCGDVSWLLLGCTLGRCSECLQKLKE